MIQVRHTTIDARLHIEVRCGASPAQLHIAGTLDMDLFNGLILLDCLDRYYPGHDPGHIEVIEVP